MNSKKGFTLIELLVVIAIIGILSSVVLASLNSARVKARIASVQSTMHSIQAQAITCMDDASPLNTPTNNNTGGNKICAAASATGLYPALPLTGGWTYTITTPGPDANGDFSFKASSVGGDGKTVTCTLSACTTTTTP